MSCTFIVGEFSYICFSMARRDAADIKGKRPFSYTDAQAHQHKLLSDARSHSAFQEPFHMLQPDELTSLNEIRLLSRIPHAFKLDRHFCSMMRITLSWSDISARQKNRVLQPPLQRLNAIINVKLEPSKTKVILRTHNTPI